MQQIKSSLGHPITKDLVAQHNLTDDECKKIVEILGQEPNLTELGMFSVMWSEHYSEESSSVDLKRLPSPRAGVRSASDWAEPPCDSLRSPWPSRRGMIGS